MKNSKLKIYFNIPNILTYLRILLIPVYLYIYISADSVFEYSIAAAIVLLSGITDFLDGRIARKYNLITEFGKVIDPAADKLTQTALVISLTFRYPLMRYVFILFIIKEAVLLSIGYWFFRQGLKMNGAQIYGKVCTTIIYIVMIVLVFYIDISKKAANILIMFSIFALLYAFIGYMYFYKNMLKERKTKLSNKQTDK